MTYDACYQHGASDQTGLTLNNTLVKRFALAVDAVRPPAGNALGVPTGTIVCRSSLTDTTNGCASLNLFG